MAYPNKVSAILHGFGVADGQDMLFAANSNPPSYNKDPDDSTPYTFALLRRNTAGTNWELIVFHLGKSFIGVRTPAADNPEGDYVSGTQTALVAVL